jgi:hypothetical protein
MRRCRLRPLAFSYSGNVTSVAPGLLPFFSIGDPLSYSFTYIYNPLALTFVSPDPAIGNPNTARYFGGSISGVGTLTGTGIGSPVGFTTFTPVPPGILRVGNNYTGAPLVGVNRDYVNFVAASSGFGGYLTQVEVRLVDFSALALSNLNLPNLAVFASLANVTAVRLTFVNDEGLPGLVISQIPLPPALLLFLTGLGLMGFLAKRKSQVGTRNLIVRRGSGA